MFIVLKIRFYSAVFSVDDLSSDGLILIRS